MRRVEGHYQLDALVETFGCLVKHKRGIFGPPSLQVFMKVNVGRQCCRIPFLIIFSSQRECLLGCLRLRLQQLGIVNLIERNAVPRDVHEEIPIVRQAVVHVLQAVHNEVHRRAQRLGNRQLLDETGLGALPIGDPVGQLLLVDDDEQVEIGLVALGRMRLVDLAFAGIGAVEDYLQDPPESLFRRSACPWRRRIPRRRSGRRAQARAACRREDDRD